MGKVKTERCLLYEKGKTVSIPYGKGKGYDTPTAHLYVFVSIPYGKGKANKVNLLIVANHVSIPYGKGKVYIK